MFPAFFCNNTHSLLVEINNDKFLNNVFFDPQTPEWGLKSAIKGYVLLI